MKWEELKRQTFNPSLKFLCKRMRSWGTSGRRGRTGWEKLADECRACERERVEKRENHVREESNCSKVYRLE